MWNRGPLIVSFSKVFQSSFKVTYRNQTETSIFQAICIFERSNLIYLLNFSMFWNIYFSCDVIISKLCNEHPNLYIMYIAWDKNRNQYLEHWIEKFWLQFWLRGDFINPKLGQKGPRLVFNKPIVVERLKPLVKGSLSRSISLWNDYLKMLKIWLCFVVSPRQKWVKIDQIGISCTNVDRKMKIIKKVFSHKLFLYDTVLSKFWSFDSLCDTVNSKRAQIVILCTNGDRKMKIKSKRNFDITHSFIKAFSQNLEILALFCDVIISNLSQKDTNLKINKNQKHFF